MRNWAKLVSHAFNGLFQDDILTLFTRSDPHWSNWRTIEAWKYATQKGVDGTPTVFVNGIKLSKVPSSISEWEEFFGTMYTSANKYERSSFKHPPMMGKY